jgi:hypothetical protein
MPTWLRVARVLPAGGVPARSQQRWLEHVDDVLNSATLRADARGNIRAVAVILARHASWRVPMVSRPTWAGTCTRTGLARSTVAAHLRWLRERHLVACWTPGRSAACVAPPEKGAAVNQAAEYLLITTPVDAGDQHTGRSRPVSASQSCSRRLGSRTPTDSRRELEQNPRARETGDPQARAERGPGLLDTSRKLTRPSALAAQRCRELAERLRVHSATVGRLSTRHVASLLRGHVAAGWTREDFVWALDHHPDARQHWQTRQVHSPAGWLRHRLDLWRDQTGAAVLSPTLEASSRRHRELAMRAASQPQPTSKRDRPAPGLLAARAALQNRRDRRRLAATGAI